MRRNVIADSKVSVHDEVTAQQQSCEIQSGFNRAQQTELTKTFTGMLVGLTKLIDFKIVLPVLGANETTWAEFKFKVQLVAQALGIEEEPEAAAVCSKDVCETGLTVKLKAQSQVLYNVLAQYVVGTEFNVLRTLPKAKVSELGKNLFVDMNLAIQDDFVRNLRICSIHPGRIWPEAFWTS